MSTVTKTGKDVEHQHIAAKNIPAVPESINKYGLKPYPLTTQFAHPIALPGFDKTNNTENIIYKFLIESLAEYMFIKHKFMTGTIGMQTDSFIPVLGNWIEIEEPNILLKVEGYDIEWEYGSVMDTTLTVTHGIMPSFYNEIFYEDWLLTTEDDDDSDPIVLQLKKIKDPKGLKSISGVDINSLKEFSGLA